jgi:ribonuclease HI
MKMTKRVFPLLVVVLAGSLISASAAERYLHVRVTDTKDHQLVRINVPLSLAEKVIPAINHGKLRNGKVQIRGVHSDEINLQAILEALKTAPEGEFVTVQSTDNNVRVAKEHGQLVVHVVDKKSKQNVDVTIPWEVAQALTSATDANELNLEAGIKALEAAGDVTLVAVNSDQQTVRVWVDSRSTSD